MGGGGDQDRISMFAQFPFRGEAGGLRKMITNLILLESLNFQQGCHGHRKVKDFLEFLEKSWNFD